MRYARLSLASVILMAGIWGTALAQEPQYLEPTPLVENLNAPRHLTVDESGALIVADAGMGGETPVLISLGEGLAGNSGVVLAINGDMEPQAIISDLYSVVTPMMETVGVHSALITESAQWYLMGQAPVENDAPVTPGTFALVKIDAEGATTAYDLYANEVANNPDGGELDSNPVDFAVAPDGSAIYIADAGANAVLKWTEADGVSTFAAWSVLDGMPQMVPTTVVTDAEGNVYVSFLTGYPFPTGGSRVEIYAPDGTLTSTIEGLSLVTDLLWSEDGSTLYAVQFAESFGETGWTPQTGSIVEVGMDGTLTPIVTGLNLPYSAVVMDEGFAVTVNTSFLPAGSGAVWMVLPGSYTPVGEALPVATEGS